MTTHYMDEAEFCDRIAIMDQGQIVALDTPAALKAQVGADRIKIETEDDDAALEALRALRRRRARRAGSRSTSRTGAQFVPRLFAELEVPITSVSVSRPSLDDVFMSFTGKTIRDAEAAPSTQPHDHAHDGERR